MGKKDNDGKSKAAQQSTKAAEEDQSTEEASDTRPEAESEGYEGEPREGEDVQGEPDTLKADDLVTVEMLMNAINNIYSDLTEMSTDLNGRIAQLQQMVLQLQSVQLASPPMVEALATEKVETEVPKFGEKPIFPNLNNK